MLISDLRKIGNKLLQTRKRLGLTQAEVAERAELSDRTYAEIERGCANMRVQTLIQICKCLNITPDEILVESNEKTESGELIKLFDNLSEKDKVTAIKLLTVFARSV